MKFTRIFARCFYIAVLVTPACRSRVEFRPAETSSRKVSSAALFDQVNEYRRSRGKPALRRDAGLDRLAQNHSEFLRKTHREASSRGRVNHDGFGKRAAIARQRYNIQTIHENVAAGPRGTSIVNLWANSRSHDRAMRGSWTVSGIGVAVASDGTVFATQLFGNKDTSRRGLPEWPGSF